MAAITSATNPRVKDVVRLQKSGAARREQGLFCVERMRELSRALDAGFEIVELYALRERLEADGVLRAARAGSRIVEVSDAVLHKMAYQEHPQGFVAVLRARTVALDELDVGGGLFVVLSGLEKPGNVGAILRSADAAGASAVLVDGASYDLFSPHCIRASTGAVFVIPVVSAGREALLAWLRRHEVTILAATPEAPTRYTDADLRGRIAFAMGAEADGLDPAWRDAAHARVSIPMRGMADSLNVSVTTAVLLFEAARQRAAAAR